MKIKEIKKGDLFLCIEDVEMQDSGNITYRKGHQYTSERDGCITNINNESDHSWGNMDNVNKFFSLLELVKDPINKAWHDKFVTHPIMPHAGEITPKMMKKFADKFAPIQEAIKPDYYKFNIKGVNCDMFDIAEALRLPVRLFSALKYFRVKGDKAKQINDLEKAIECIKLEIERLKR